jgi:hypothetical protein
VHRRPPGDQARPVARLVLAEPGPVDHPRQHLARVERDPEVRRRDAEQLVRVVPRRVGGLRRAGAELAPVQLRDDLPADPDAVRLVGGELIGQPGDARVHVRAAELLVAGVLPGGHLHQRRPAEEDLGLAVDQNAVVAHPGHVRATGRGVAEDQRDRRDAHGRQLGEVVEDLAGVHEQFRLGRQVRAAGLDQVDHRQPVRPGDLQRPQRLAQRVGVHRAAADRRVVRDDHALRAGHHADPGDDARPDGELGSPGRERGQLQERRVPVQQQLDALAHQHPAALVMALGVPRPAPRAGQAELLLQRGDRRELRGAVARVGLAGDVHRGTQHRHPAAPLGPGTPHTLRGIH